MEAAINPKTGFVDNPIHPCYKAEGLCKVRMHPLDAGLKFECGEDPKWCRYLQKIGGNDGRQ